MGYLLLPLERELDDLPEPPPELYDPLLLEELDPDE